jgi:KAP family P-loop domain
MSLKLLENAITTFVASSTPEVLCLTGKWGVGKTYAWKHFLEKAKDEGNVTLPKYAYVSLFGLGSLDRLRSAIFEYSIASKDIGVEPSLASLKTNTVAVLTALDRRSLSLLALTPKTKDMADAISAASFLSVTKTIVCIDDLERKSQSLQMRDVLGLVSYLKEERRCKVVLIFNEDVIEGQEADEFRRYVEKVADSKVKFAPSAADCVSIALPEQTDMNRRIGESCISLGISNIRLVKRITRLAYLVEPILGKLTRAYWRPL